MSLRLKRQLLKGWKIGRWIILAFLGLTIAIEVLNQSFEALEVEITNSQRQYYKDLHDRNN